MAEETLGGGVTYSGPHDRKSVDEAMRAFAETHAEVSVNQPLTARIDDNVVLGGEKISTPKNG